MDRPVAAIDVGTNTVLLLVATASPDGTIVPLLDAYRVPRLGAGVDARKTLRADAIARVIDVLQEYHALATKENAHSIAVCATSAVRDSSNRDAFAAEVFTKTGLTVEVLGGEAEAFWSYQGALSGIAFDGRCLVLDIGGGSTELISGTRQRITARQSLNIGAVRLTERCFHHDPPTPAELEDATRIIEETLSTLDTPPAADARLIAVAGTPTSLATLSLGLCSFSSEAVAGYTMSRSAIEQEWDRLRNLPSAEILRLSDVMEGRADVITAGTLILRTVMDRYQLTAMTVSERGLRYGIALRELGLVSGPSSSK
jgi:exopolyphosphatase / guanosine-5'-triphosphate,3'-diphosphate pyrophosphatase